MGKCWIHEGVGVNGDAGSSAGCGRTGTKCRLKNEGFILRLGLQLLLVAAIPALVECLTGTSIIREGIQEEKVGTAGAKLHICRGLW